MNPYTTVTLLCVNLEFTFNRPTCQIRKNLCRSYYHVSIACICRYISDTICNLAQIFLGYSLRTGGSLTSVIIFDFLLHTRGPTHGNYLLICHSVEVSGAVCGT